MEDSVTGFLTTGAPAAGRSASPRSDTAPFACCRCLLQHGLALSPGPTVGSHDTEGSIRWPRPGKCQPQLSGSREWRQIQKNKRGTSRPGLHQYAHGMPHEGTYSMNRCSANFASNTSKTDTRTLTSGPLHEVASECQRPAICLVQSQHLGGDGWRGKRTECVCELFSRTAFERYGTAGIYLTNGI